MGIFIVAVVAPVVGRLHGCREIGLRCQELDKGVTVKIEGVSW